MTMTAIDHQLASLERSIESDRDRLIDNLEWLIRDLTREVETLRADPTRSPSTSIMSGSLPHDIERATASIGASLTALSGIKAALKFDNDCEECGSPLDEAHEFCTNPKCSNNPLPKKGEVGELT
jgi:hypothetical protein